MSEDGRRLTRKDFLVGLPIAVAGLGVLLRRGAEDGAGMMSASLAPGLGRGLGKERAAHPVGVQLYTLRSLMGDDLEGTLTALAEMGYEEVEFAGLWGRSPQQMRTLLDERGLRAASSHHGLNEVRGDWNATLEAAATLGQDLIVVPSINRDEQTLDGLLAVAEDFNAAGEAARAMGLSFGYHNHAWEFEALPDGTLPYDLLLEKTDPELVSFQMDVFWTVHGGADPMEYFGAYPGRFTSVHVKDRTVSGEMVSVGDGVIDFTSLVSRADRAGIRHYFVEHDNPEDPIRSVRRSYAALSRVLG